MTKTLLELAGTALVAAGAGLYDVRIALIVIGVYLLYVTRTPA
jgi:hypothetical protein